MEEQNHSDSVKMLRWAILSVFVIFCNSYSNVYFALYVFLMIEWRINKQTNKQTNPFIPKYSWNLKMYYFIIYWPFFLWLLMQWTIKMYFFHISKKLLCGKDTLYYYCILVETWPQEKHALQPTYHIYIPALQMPWNFEY